MAELTSTGLETRTQAEILAQIEADQRAEISTSLDQSTSSPLGQVNRLFARSLALSEEALAALYLAVDPDSATGDALDRLAALSGTVREPAQASRIAAVFDLDAGTYAAGTLAAAPTGRPGDRFTNATEITSAGGNTAVILLAEETGPTVVPANVLEIAGPVSGWNSIVSSEAADVGAARETDAALRQRRTREVESPGSASASGIVADITRTLPLVLSAYTVENDTDSTVDSIPPHSIEVIVFGPDSPTSEDDEAVAAQILASKAAGIGTYGTTSVTVLDDEDQPHLIRFTRPAEVPLTVTLTVQTRAGTYAGDASLAAYLAERAEAELEPGLDVAGSMIAAWAHGVAGVLRVTSVTVNGGAAWAVQTITSRQIATLDAGDVTVTSAGATP